MKQKLSFPVYVLIDEGSFETIGVKVIGRRFSEIKSLFKNLKYFVSSELLFIFKEMVSVIILLLKSLICPAFPHKLIQKSGRTAAWAASVIVQ